MDAPRIDPGSGIPPYRQLASALCEQITRGELRGRLPSEKTLAQEWDVAVGTVRKALALLRDAGVVATHAGYGSRVVPPEERGKD